MCAACLLWTAETAGQTAAGDRPRQTVRMAATTELYAGVNIQDAQVAMQLWLNAVNKRVDLIVDLDLTIFYDPSAGIQAVKDGEIDLLGMTGLGYLRSGDGVPLDPLVVGLWGEPPRATVEYVLLVRRDLGVEAVGDLRDREVIVGTLDRGQTARMWLDVLLLREKLPASEGFFAQVEKVDRASQAVLPVYFGQTDACVVRRRSYDTLVELNPQLGEELAILATSPPLLLQLMCAASTLDSVIREALIEAAARLPGEPEGRQMLMLFRSDRTARFEARHLQATADLVAEHDAMVARAATGVK